MIEYPCYFKYHSITTVKLRNLNATGSLSGTVNKVLHLNQTALPKMIKCNDDTARDFNNFFYQKEAKTFNKEP